MRESALISTRVWRRPEFRALHRWSQLLYFAIRTTPTLSRVGVTTLLPDLWVEWTNMTQREVKVALVDLRSNGIIAIDDETAELFIEDAIHDEYVFKVPTVLERAIRDAEAVRSRPLQLLIASVFEASSNQRALDAAAALIAQTNLEPSSILRKRNDLISASELKELRRSFAVSAGRRRLHAEIKAGLHTCPCGATNSLTVDHIVPLARGGTNAYENMQVLCVSCNSRKGSRV
jgi:hypothetical protein